MRKLIRVGVLALTATAIMATPALAQHPDFPHADFDPNNWSAATVHNEVGQPCQGAPAGGVACDFDTGTENDWTWVWGWQGSSGHSQCSGGIEGDLSFDGSIDVTAASLADAHGAYWLCDDMQPAELPWEGQVCVHGPTGEAWARQEMTLSHSSGSWVSGGVTFGSTDGTALEYGPGTGPGGLTAVSSLEGHWHGASLPFDGPGYDIGAAESPCGWPELQA